MRLIDADELKTEINFTVTITGKDNAAEVKRLMELYNKAISNAPTINAEPVKHGEWIDHGTTCQRYECSVCGDQHDWLILPNNINFCPNCGAKMKGTEE